MENISSNLAFAGPGYEATSNHASWIEKLFLSCDFSCDYMFTIQFLVFLFPQMMNAVCTNAKLLSDRRLQVVTLKGQQTCHVKP